MVQEAKEYTRNLSMAWIDYKKAYDMVPHMVILILKKQQEYQKLFNQYNISNLVNQIVMCL